jgi:hypothetical protein
MHDFVPAWTKVMNADPFDLALGVRADGQSERAG